MSLVESKSIVLVQIRDKRKGLASYLVREAVLVYT